MSFVELSLNATSQILCGVVELHTAQAVHQTDSNLRTKKPRFNLCASGSKVGEFTLTANTVKTSGR